MRMTSIAASKSEIASFKFTSDCRADSSALRSNSTCVDGDGKTSTFEEKLDAKRRLVGSTSTVGTSITKMTYDYAPSR